jgi:hypothetical protein
MSSGIMLDLRRTDLRTNVLENPYWITSAEITPACDDQDAVLFSFPITKSVSPGYGNNLIFIHQVALEIVTAFAGGTVALDIGQGSLATDAVTTAGIVTDVDPDMYLLNADITLGTKGWYLPTTGKTSAWLTDIAAKTFTTDITITPADATVLAVVAYLTSSDTITAGAARFHMLVSELPSDR